VRPLVRRIAERQGRWIRIVMDAPRGNLLSLQMVRDLDHALDAAVGTPGLRWLTVEGAGGEFSFGADIKEHLAGPMRIVLPETHALLRKWLSVPVATAALVEGRCLGGGFELALCCDDILAHGKATFGCPEINVAAFAPIASLLLPLRVGASRATRALVAGGHQPARYWHRAGLVSLVAPGHELRSSAGQWFDRRLAGKSAVALGHAVRAARTLVRAHVDPHLDRLERQYLDELLSTADAAEGVNAWLEKRTPNWSDS
jgi:cyclohexa-1,5-dienecarbonyl-CoA hydratase